MDTSETKCFGRYQIMAELGRGAMGVVYQARDPQIDRLVAVKTISLLGVEPEHEQEFRERFHFEAKAAGRLHHSSIVTIFDVGEDPHSRESYIVLEYVPGESLSRLLSRQRKLPLLTAIQLAEELADALDYAHAQGVVHRDIKPANILIAEDGRAKIADFGIARLNLAHYTFPGRILGTPAYMAPEQLSGEGVDGRSDLFSLGVILYSMVTGYSPFQGDSATTVCFKVVNREPVPASSFDLDLPRSLDAIIACAMAKDPAERYQRGSELADDLRQLREQYKAGSTTTSTWDVAPSAGTGSRETLASPDITLATMVRGKRPVRTAVAHATSRNLILAATAVVTLIIILGNPSTQTAPSPRAANAATTVSTSPLSSARQSAKTLGSIGPETASAVAGTLPKGISGRKTEPVMPNEAASRRPLKQVIVLSSTLEISVQHHFKEATLWVWVDDKLALTRPMFGGTQKRMVVFNGIRGIGSETLQVPSGQHIFRVRAQTADLSIDLSKTVSGDFISGDDKTLHVTFDKRNTAIHLDWQ